MGAMSELPNRIPDRPRERRLRGGTILGLVSGLLVVVGTFGLDRLSFPFCGFRAITGLPCPLCFGTRATAALSRGEIPEAFSLNPLVSAGFFAALLTGILLLLGKEPPWLSPRRERPLLFLALAGLGINWIYLIAST